MVIRSLYTLPLMPDRNCLEAVPGLFSSLFTAGIQWDGAEAVPEQPSWELGTCTSHGVLQRQRLGKVTGEMWSMGSGNNSTDGFNLNHEPASGSTGNTSPR